MYIERERERERERGGGERGVPDAINKDIGHKSDDQ